MIADCMANVHADGRSIGRFHNATLPICHGYDEKWSVEQLECVHILCAYTMEIAHKFKLQMHTHKQQSIALAASYVLQQIIVSNHQLMQLDS